MSYRVSSRMWPWRSALCMLVGFAIYSTLLHLDPKRLSSGLDPTGIEKLLLVGAVIFGPAVLGLFLTSRVVLELSDDGLSRQWLFGRTTARWDEIVRVRLDWDHGLLGLGAVLKLDRPKRRSWLFWRERPATLRLDPALTDGGRLLRDVLARAPHAEVGKGIRAYLAAPRRTPWTCRAPVLLVLGLQAGLCAVGLARVIVSTRLGIAHGMAVCVLAVLSPFIGRALERERWWKTLPLDLGAGLGAVVGPSAMLAVMFGVPGRAIVALAGGLGWAVATLAVCLPWRPRWPGVVVGYVLAMAVAVGGAWRHCTSEPMPFRSTGRLAGSIFWVAWSPDGSRLAVTSLWLEPNAELHRFLVDAATGRARSLVAPGLLPVVWMPNADWVLAFGRQERADDGQSLCELWALDVASGKASRVHVAETVSRGFGYADSPDGGEVAFIAGPKGREELHILRLADLSVREIPVEGEQGRFGSVRWLPNDQLVLIASRGGRLDNEEEEDAEPVTLSFWTCSPAGGRPERLYEITAPSVGWHVGRGSHWALVSVGPDWETVERHELVDLTTGTSRAVDLRGLTKLSDGEWSPDGEAFAYVLREGGEHAIRVVGLATATVTRRYASRDPLWRLRLSVGARYACCMVETGRRGRPRIIDLTTGKTVTLRQKTGWLSGLFEYRWSPARPTLAIERPDPFRIRGGTTIRFFDFPDLPASR